MLTSRQLNRHKQTRHTGVCLCLSVVCSSTDRHKHTRPVYSCNRQTQADSPHRREHPQTELRREETSERELRRAHTTLSCEPRSGGVIIVGTLQSTPPPPLPAAPLRFALLSSAGPCFQLPPAPFCPFRRRAPRTMLSSGGGASVLASVGARFPCNANACFSTLLRQHFLHRPTSS
jgi:hypothetical protein